MILDRKHFIFLVQVIDEGYVNAAGDYEVDRVLVILNFLNKGWLCVGEPTGSCIHKNKPDKGHICDKFADPIWY